MDDPGVRLARLEAGCTTAEALEFFDSLEPVRAEELLGDWAGRELPTGHRLDGTLAASGWHGKRFASLDDIDPLVFRTPSGHRYAADPRRLPLALAGRVPPRLLARARPLLGLAEPLVRATKPRARLRDLDHRGVVTAAMVYDHLPIIDVFRRVDDDTLLGLMDRRADPRPYFFVLTRDS